MVGDATLPTPPRLMFDILGGPWPVIGAVLSMIILLAGVVAFGMYICDETKHAGNST